MVIGELGGLSGLAEGVIQSLDPACALPRLGQPEQTPFGLFDDVRRALLTLQPRLIRLAQGLLTEGGQLAAHIEIMDRARVMLGIDKADHVGGEVGQILRAADMFELAVALERVLQGHRAGDLAIWPRSVSLRIASYRR
jgi:hypothetical protein